MKGNYINDINIAVITLAESLEYSSLEILNLSSTNILLTGVIAISKSLEENKTKYSIYRTMALSQMLHFKYPVCLLTKQICQNQTCHKI